MLGIDIKRNLDENTRKQAIVINGAVYSLHITTEKEVIITDNDNYESIYSIQSLGFYKSLYAEKE